MPRIDPLKLLTCLKVLLAPNGGIRSANEVKRLAELMAKYSKKLVSKCIYIQILKSTDTELLGKFMGVGGWLLTHMWLSEGIRAANWPLVQEILELLLLCPVDVERLRSNTAPKLVKGLSKDGGNEGVRILATKLVEQWLKVVKGETMGSDLPPGSVPPAGIPTSGTLVIQQAGNKNDLQSPQQNSTQSADTMNSPNSKTDDGLVYKIVVKDGKQMLAKVVNSSETESASQETVDGASESSATIEDKQSDKENRKETEERDKDSDKEKSRSSKDKDRHRDHKSSSSSRHKSSSSSKSSSKSSSSSSTSKSKSSSSSSKHRDKDSSSDKDKHKSSSSSKSSSSHHSSKDRDKDRSRSKDKDREREKSHSKSSDKEKDKSLTEKSEKEREKLQSEKDLAEIEKMTLPSIDKLGKIPKKPREEGGSGTDQSAVVPTSITIPSKKASMSIEIRRDQNRPKTVKTFNSQFRSHGLSEEAPPPPSRKGLKKPPAQPIPGTSIPPSFGSSTLLSKRLSPPPSNGTTIKEPAEKKIKFDLTTAPTTEKPGAVKFIAPKPKPSTLVESDMFMDALFAAAPPKKDARKRKRRSSASKDSSKDGGSSEEPESPVANKVAPLKFYQDTLEDSERAANLDESREDFIGSEERNDDEDDIPLKKVKEQIEDRVREEKELEERRIRETEEPDENPVKKPPGPGCGPDGPPGVLMLHRRKGPKKKLTWRAQEQLEEIRFFELDETERVNVTKTFTDMKQMEHFKEREGFMLSRKLNADDVMVEQTAWTTPLIMVDDVPPHPEGSQSKEKKIQMERELTTLKALYFNRQMIPDSSAEPDMEQYQMTEPAVIPLDDITGNPDAINDFTSMPWPDPKGSPPPGEDFMGTDMGFPGGPFNPFMSFGANGGWMGPAMPGPPNGVMPPMGAPMGNFNGIMPGPQGMMMPGGPPMMMGSPNDMNMMAPPFGGPNFNGPPNNGMGGAGFPNFGPPMNMNPNNMNMNMNNGPPRGGQGGRGGGNWRSGSAGPPGGGGGGSGGGGGNWRGGGGRGGGGRGGGGGGGGPGGRICKQFQRGYCRNGNKCNFYHPPGGANQRF